MSYAIDVRARSSRFLGVDIERGYERFGITIDELPGSNDLEGKRRDDVPVVLDLKFGWEQVEKAEHNVQLKVYVTARAWERGAETVEGRIVKFDQEGNARIDRHEFDQLAIDLFADELEEGVDRVRKTELVYLAGHMPTVKIGPWCKYCPGMAHCPEHFKLARAMLPELVDIDARLATLSPVERGQAWLRLQSIFKLGERIEKALNALAIQEPYPTSDWKEVRANRSTSRTLDQGAAIALLHAKGATDAEVAALYRVTETERVGEFNQPGKKAPRGKAKKRVLPMVVDGFGEDYDRRAEEVRELAARLGTEAMTEEGQSLSVEEMQALVAGGSEP